MKWDRADRKMCGRKWGWERRQESTEYPGIGTFNAGMGMMKNIGEKKNKKWGS